MHEKLSKISEIGTSFIHKKIASYSKRKRTQCETNNSENSVAIQLKQKNKLYTFHY